MDLKTARVGTIICFISFIIIGFLAIFFADFVDGEGFPSILIALFVVNIIVGLAFNFGLRCPSCRRSLGRNWLFARHCSRCGNKLNS